MREKAQGTVGSMDCPLPTVHSLLLPGCAGSIQRFDLVGRQAEGQRLGIGRRLPAILRAGDGQHALILD